MSYLQPLCRLVGQPGQRGQQQRLEQHGQRRQARRGGRKRALQRVRAPGVTQGGVKQQHSSHD
jgi:hypothetical protein